MMLLAGRSGDFHHSAEVSIAFHGSRAYPLHSTSKHALGGVLDLAILPLGFKL